MTANNMSPTEALLQVARTRPFAPAVRAGSNIWSYAALWARVRDLSKKIDQLDGSGAYIGLFMGLEIDYVAAAHAVWLSGCTTVFLSPKWSPAVLESILKRTNVRLVIYGVTSPPTELSVPSFCTFDFVSVSPPSFCPPPQSFEIIQKVPLICSITPTSGSTGVPKSIVYPMRKSLAVLDEESSTLLKPQDGQWLRGGTTFLRPLFEIRRFMFNKTTLYLDDGVSVADQCATFCAELDNPSNHQPLRVHFTPSVFRAFVDYVKMKYGPSHSFSRLYWMVIGGESLSVTDLRLAKQVFPRATIACNYACSEVGFAGVSQMFVRPDEVVPELINFNATQGCEDLVLLDDDMNIIPKHDGASGIIGIITTASATHYMGNEEASRHMFRPWGGDRILLYTDDIGNMAADGRITINGRRSRNVKINGLFVDMDHIERALIGSFPDDSVNAYKLVKSTERIILFWSGQSTNVKVLKCVRESLNKSLGENLALVVSSTRHIEEMPYNASYKIDLAKLQSIADEDLPTAPPAFAPSDPDNVLKPVKVVCSHVDEIAEEVAAQVAQLSKTSNSVAVDVPLTLVGLNSLTVVQLYFWLQERYDYDDDMSRLFGEEVTALVLARDITGEREGTDRCAAPSSTKKMEIAMDIASEVARLTKSTQPVPTDVPLVLVGINSITVIQLHFWLQSTFEYEKDMSRLFEENCSAEALAGDILGDNTEVASDTDSDVTRVDESVPSDDEIKTIAAAIATEVAKLSKATEPVAIDVPLMLAGLNSITVVQLHFWLQSHYEYEEEMSRLFEQDVSCEVVAHDIRVAHCEPAVSTSAAIQSDSESQDVVEAPSINVALVEQTFKPTEFSKVESIAEERSESDVPVSGHSISVSSMSTTPAPKQSSRRGHRATNKPEALNLSSSTLNAKPKASNSVDLPLRTGGLMSAGMQTADLRAGATFYGLLACTLLQAGTTPSRFEAKTPIAQVSPWISGGVSSSKMLCI